MPYTFGAGTGDDLTIAPGASSMVTGTALLVAGWWTPTALTAGNGLWSTSNICGCQLSSVAGSITVTTDNTTDGAYDFAVGLTVGVARFVAVLGMFSNTGPTTSWRVWTATVTSAPVPAAAGAFTDAVGNFLGGGNWFIGNKGTTTAAFQGDIENVVFMQDSNAGPCSPLGPANFFAWSQAEADLIARTYVLPLWLGDYAKIVEGGRLATQHTIRWHAECNGPLIVGRPLTAIPPNLVATVNGATDSAANAGRPLISRPFQPVRRR